MTVLQLQSQLYCDFSDDGLLLYFSDYQIQEKLEVEKRRLEELEAEHQETCRSLRGDSVVDTDGEQADILQKRRREQHELEHQRYILDDLEFQMFEAGVII